MRRTLTALLVSVLIGQCTELYAYMVSSEVIIFIGDYSTSNISKMTVEESEHIETG